MEIIKVIITICSTVTGHCEEKPLKLYNHSQSPAAIVCIKGTMKELPGLYNAMSNSSYRIVKWKCERPTS